VKTVKVNAGGDQRLFPEISDDGTPVWQPGDSDVVAWEIESMGWTHGAPSNRRDNPGIHGSLYLTGARVFAVSDDFVHGNRYRPLGIGAGAILDVVATKVSQARASRAAQGSFLVGQLRMPWIKSVVFGGPINSKRSRGEIRLVGEHVTSFGDSENVMFMVGLRHAAESFSFVTALTERIKQDRLERPGLTDESRELLNHLPSPESVQVGPNELAMINYAGAFRVRPDTVSRGVQSALSYPNS